MYIDLLIEDAVLKEMVERKRPTCVVVRVNKFVFF